MTATSGERVVRASSDPGHSGSRRPSPTAVSAPTRLRTIEWQNASAEACTSTTSPSRTTSRASSVRMVVANSRRRQ